MTPGRRIVSLAIPALPVLLGSAAFQLTAQSPTRAVRTVLFTAAPPNVTTEYFVAAFDTLARSARTAPRLDTLFAIGGHEEKFRVERGRIVGGRKVCLRLDPSRLGSDSILQLTSSAVDGQEIATVYINVARDSWTWDGAAQSASLAPPC